MLLFLLLIGDWQKFPGAGAIRLEHVDHEYNGCGACFPSSRMFMVLPFDFGISEFVFIEMMLG